MEQTAVEWLAELIECGADLEQLKKCLPKAKEMQDEQMQLTWNNAIDAVQKDKWESYDDFYNNNFKSE